MTSNVAQVMAGTRNRIMLGIFGVSKKGGCFFWGGVEFDDLRIKYEVDDPNNKKSMLGCMG